jgi:O-antigen/teichoic acid export membrane protein
LRGAILGSVAALAIQWALNHYALRRECAKANISYQFAGSHRELGMLYRFSLPAFLASILVVAAIWVCNALLARQPQGYAELGLYAAADKWRVLIVFLPTYVFAMIVPVLSNLHGEGDGVGFQKVFNANFRVNVGLALVLAVLIAVFAGPIMAMYGSSCGGGRIVLMVLAFSAFGEVLNAILGQPLIASNRMWRRFGFNFVFVALLLGSAWVLIPKRGAIGLAVAYAVANAATAMALFLFHQQSSWSSSRSQDSQRQQATKVTGESMRKL